LENQHDWRISMIFSGVTRLMVLLAARSA